MTFFDAMGRYMTRCKSISMKELCVRRSKIFCQFTLFRTMKCSFDVAKRGFYRAANGIFGKIGRTASEEVWAYSNEVHSHPALCIPLQSISVRVARLCLDSSWNCLEPVIYRLLLNVRKSFALICRVSMQLARRRKKFLDKLYHCHSV